MGESRESGQGQARLNGLTGTPRAIGPICVTQRGPAIELHFPPLRSAVPALMLALFGAACGVIGGAAISGVLRSGGSESASLLALAFAGVFALPLTAVGLLFIGIAIWTAASSFTVEVSPDGLRLERRCCGFTIAREVMPREDIMAIDVRLAAKYIGVFSATRYYRLIARNRGSAGLTLHEVSRSGRMTEFHNRGLLIADSLQGSDMTEEVKRMIIGHLDLPQLATSGETAHLGARGTEV